jgi:hypothetical protein
MGKLHRITEVVLAVQALCAAELRLPVLVWCCRFALCRFLYLECIPPERVWASVVPGSMCITVAA